MTKYLDSFEDRWGELSEIREHILLQYLSGTSLEKIRTFSFISSLLQRKKHQDALYYGILEMIRLHGNPERLAKIKEILGTGQKLANNQLRFELTFDDFVQTKAKVDELNKLLLKIGVTPSIEFTYGKAAVTVG